MKKYWFKQKRYGIGFYPVTKEGWLATITLVVLMLISAYTNGFFSLGVSNESTISTQSGLRFFLDVTILAGVFTALFERKLEGGLEWKWGEGKK